MIIQCPSCGARAKLPDSKEGAKVRCGECQRVYVAGMGRRGSARSATSNNHGLWIGIGLAVVSVIVLLFIMNNRSGDKFLQAGLNDGDADAASADDGPSPDAWGYDGTAAKAARELHRLAFARNGESLRARLHGPAIHAWKTRAAARAAALAAAEAAGLDSEATAAAVEDALIALPDEETLMNAFDSLPVLEKTQHIEAWIEELISGSAADLVAEWAPYDGETIELTQDTAIVRLKVNPAAGDSSENRTVEWKLRKKGGRWLAARWERHLTQAELDDLLRAKLRSRRGPKGYEKVELSDGSVVLEREPEALPHLADTPAEVRSQIDVLMATMLDLSLTREATRAREELIAIGKPAIPPLLTKLYETPLDTEDQSIQVNQVVVALRDITGEYFGYEPMELIGSGVGTSRERRESSIKQWFAWWYRNEDRFTERVLVDALDEMIELTEEEKAYLERIKD